jgi:methyl-accepting chemotaxis protein
VRIGLRIGAIMASVILAATAFQLWFFLSRQSDTVSKALEDKAIPLAVLASHNVSSALEYDDREEMKKVLDSFLRDPDASFAGVYDNGSQLLSSVGADAPLRTLRVQPVTRPTVAYDEGAILRVHVPLSTPSGFKGTLVAGFTTDSVAAERRDVLFHSILVTLVIGIAAVVLGLGYGATLGRRLGRIAIETERIAEGDLSRPLLRDAAGDEIGRTARSFDQMVTSQRELVRQMHDTLLQLNSTAGQFLSTAQQQERGSTEQSSAVEETNRTLTSLLGSAREIAQAAQGVTRNAERTQDNTSQMAQRIGDLSRQVERITAILELIKGIASKSEILALNAALEGTKAGEAGRGFSLVASQMQRLAENVMEAVRDIRNLTDSIREATQGSVMATEESIKLSNDTTRSARQIELIIEQQQSATEQVAVAMRDVAQVATQTASASKEIVASTEDVLELCERLRALVGRYTIEHGRASQA